VEQIALTDARFRVLGNHLDPLHKAPEDLVEHAFGLFLCVRVWAYCIERGLLAIHARDADAIYPGLAEAMVDAELAEIIKDKKGQIKIPALLRIKGGKGRLDYLQKKKEMGNLYGPMGAVFGIKGKNSGHLGGRPRKDGKPPQGGDIITPGQGGLKPPLSGDRKPPPLTPALTPALTTPEVSICTKKKVFKRKTLSGKPDSLPSFQEIISDLNQKAATVFRETTPKTRELIQARWNEGFRLEDFQIVHSNMIKEWLHDPKMRPYLRPITLYSNKFESYRNRIVEGPLDRLSEEGRETFLAGERWQRRKEAELDGEKRLGEIPEADPDPS